MPFCENLLSKGHLTIDLTSAHKYVNLNVMQIIVHNMHYICNNFFIFN